MYCVKNGACSVLPKVSFPPQEQLCSNSSIAKQQAAETKLPRKISFVQEAGTASMMYSSVLQSQWLIYNFLLQLSLHSICQKQRKRQQQYQIRRTTIKAMTPHLLYPHSTVSYPVGYFFALYILSKQLTPPLFFQ